MVASGKGSVKIVGSLCPTHVQPPLYFVPEQTTGRSGFFWQVERNCKGYQSQAIHAVTAARPAYESTTRERARARPHVRAHTLVRPRTYT